MEHQAHRPQWARGEQGRDTDLEALLKNLNSLIRGEIRASFSFFSVLPGQQHQACEYKVLQRHALAHASQPMLLLCGAYLCGT